MQIISIITSLVSLAIGATKTLLLHPTAETRKQHQSKKLVTAKHILPIFIPAMLFCCTPRLLCLGVELAYLKVWSLIFLSGFIVISWVINGHYGRKDPLQTLSGVISNLFAPCVLISDRSRFFMVSNIVTIVFQCISLIGIMTFTGLEVPWIAPTPENNPPIMQCFNTKNETTPWPTDSWITSMARCNSTHCFSLGVEVTDKGFVTNCSGMPAWLPLAIVGGVLIVWLLLSVRIIFLLHYLSDPVGLLVMSKKTLFHCCPKYRPQMWYEDYSKFAVPILGIMNVSKEDFKAKKDDGGVNMSLDKLISVQLRNEEDEEWWLNNKKMGAFYRRGQHEPEHSGAKCMHF